MIQSFEFEVSEYNNPAKVMISVIKIIFQSNNNFQLSFLRFITTKFAIIKTNNKTKKYIVVN
ncbi:hypothetical protein GCM10023210_01130 [Chryseobacterium ginsengisoli]|uniref:Uncharacterized protein n=1 Tax=Chryseobacterium ginsengisoli TaxID=363853 RepID=A0ABP9LPZ5_9FLAO